MSSVLVVGFVDDATRVATAVNLATFLSAPEKPAALTSVSSDTLVLDLFLHDYSEKRVRDHRSKPGLLNLFDEYTAAILAEDTTTPNANRVLEYGSLKLTAPAEYLIQVSMGDRPLLVLRGAPRAFSQDQPLTGNEPPIIWTDFWRNWAGAAFFEHILSDLASFAETSIIDCNGETDLAAAERVASVVDIVLLVVDSTSEGAKGRAYHFGREVSQLYAGQGPEIIAVPASVHTDTSPALTAQFRRHFQRYFGEFAPPDLERYWFVDSELPYVYHYAIEGHPILQQPLEEVNVGLYHAYQNLAGLLSPRLDRPHSRIRPATELAVEFMDARQGVRWDVFISYSSNDTAAAASLRDYLRRRQLRAFLAKEDMAISVNTDSWRAAISRVLARSQVLVVIVSQSSMESVEVRYEIDEFKKTDRLVVPVVIQNTELSAPLLDLHHAIWWSPETQHLDDVSDLMPLLYGGLATTLASLE